VTAIALQVASLAVAWGAAASAADHVGAYHVGETVRVFRPAVVRDWRGAVTEALVTRIWYPVATTVPEAPHDIGPPGDPIFRGHPAAVDAPLSAARATYPLLLLSHGTGGSADSEDWLGAGLAGAGYVVVGVNHPGNNALEPLTADGFVLWWERATDLSDALDGMLADRAFGPHIDHARIGAIGFSLGGYTVLELAGARTDLEAFEEFCRSPQADVTCRPPEMQSLADTEAVHAAPSPARRASVARAGASYRDARIRAVFAIAPAVGEAFDATSFREVRVPVALLGGSADVTVPVATNIARVAHFLPAATVTMLPGVSHYTFLDTCVPSADDTRRAYCVDNPGVDRDAVHLRTVDQVRAFFDGAL